MPSGRSWAVNASNAIAASGSALSGVPLTVKLPAVKSRSSCGGLQLVRGDLPGLVDDSVAGHVDRDATDGERARAVGVEAERADGGVGVEDVDVLRRHAELVGHDHRPRGLVALAVGRCAGDDLDLVGRQHPHGGRLPAAGPVVEGGEDARRREAAHLEVAREADAQPLGRAGHVLGLLLGADLLVIGEFGRLLGRGEVVAGVVDQAAEGGVRELLGLDEVALAQLHRVDADLRGQRVHGPLDGVGGLRPPGAAVGVGGRHVGEDRRAAEVVRRR